MTSRPRPWYLLTRPFWYNIGIVLQEIFGVTCYPPIKPSIPYIIIHLIIAIVCLPFAFVGFVICIIYEFLDRNAYFSSISPSKTISTLKPKKYLGILSNNTCLMQEGPARINNLPFTSLRAKAIADFLLDPSGIRSNDLINLSLPNDLDVICLQEVFAEEAWEILNSKLASKYPHILYDAQRTWISPTHFTLVNSGLYIASKFPILTSKFYPFSDGYFDDSLSCKGILCAEIQTSSSTSVIVTTTHMQAPTSSFTKSSSTRESQYKEMENFLVNFRGIVINRIQAEVLCGDFNTDPRSSIDDGCFKSRIFEDFHDPLADCLIGTCLLEKTVRSKTVSSPEGLKKVLLAKDPKYVWSSTKLLKDDKVECLNNGSTRFDYLLIKSPENCTPLCQLHTELAGLTDHIPISMSIDIQNQ